MKITYASYMNPNGGLISKIFKKIRYSNGLFIEGKKESIFLELKPDIKNDPYNCSTLSKEQLIKLKSIIENELLESNK